MKLILGGARSGKSHFAEEQAHKLADERKVGVAYIATAIGFDKDMKDRIKKHQASRPSNWYTIEQYRDFDTLIDHEGFNASEVVLMDCMTLMVSNLLLENSVDFDTIGWLEIDQIERDILAEIKCFLAICQVQQKEVLIVSNEVGLGIVPAYRLGSIFRDIAGRINQLLAKEADHVYFLIAGIPQRIK